MEIVHVSLLKILEILVSVKKTEKKTTLSKFYDLELMVVVIW